MKLVTLKPLIKALADGQYHSGESLGEALGISRAAVWKQIQQLSAFGLTVASSKGLGYCLPEGVDLYNPANIVAKLSGPVRQHLGVFSVFDEVESTNLYLQSQPPEHLAICLAEFQSAGKGRRGRQWVSPMGASVCLSIQLRAESGVASLEGLSLAVGVVVAQALESLGVSDVALKWPNDILLNGKKLGGILIEVGGDLSGDCHAIIGLGLNVRMPEQAAETIDQPWVDLKSAGFVLARDELAATLIEYLVALANGFERQGFARYQEAWMARAAYLGLEVTLTSAAHSVDGVFQGVDEKGAIVLRGDETKGEAKAFTGGELSLRVRA